MLATRKADTMHCMLHYCAGSLKKIDGVCHAFMTKQGGTSPAAWNSLNVSYHVGDVAARVDENRARICMQWGVLPTALYVPKQVHKTGLIRVDKQSDFLQIRQQEADAIYTCDPDVLVGVSTADCAPILLACDNAHAVCAIHAGWRGTALGIVLHVLKQLQQDLGIAPCQWHAAIGPCIGADSFLVGADVFEAFSGYQNCFIQQSEHTWSFDLAKTLSQQLQECGVEQIETLRLCTVKNKDVFFSHRTASGRACGRQLSFIGIRKYPILET